MFGRFGVHDLRDLAGLVRQIGRFHRREYAALACVFWQVKRLDKSTGSA
jgi:hypothetical protein